jgi:glycosyltransferase involved in cell wall biosynthesis
MASAAGSSPKARDRSGPVGWIAGRIPTWLSGRKSIASALRATGAQVFHATDPQRPWIGPARATIVTVYDLIPLRETEMLSSWRLDYRVAYQRYLRQIGSASRVMAISCATATDVHERLGVDRDLIDVVYPVVEPPDRRQRVVPPSPTFLVVGALDVHKQPDLALHAFGRFRSMAGAGRMRLIGPAAPSEVDRLRALAEGLGIADSVSIEGRVTDDVLEAAYASATALLSTSRLEGFGLPPVEAILRGVPVIAVDTAAARETLADGAVIVPANPDAIAVEMTRPRAPSEAAASAMGQRFSRATVATSLARCYRRALDGASRV